MTLNHVIDGFQRPPLKWQIVSRFQSVRPNARETIMAALALWVIVYKMVPWWCDKLFLGKTMVVGTYTIWPST